MDVMYSFYFHVVLHECACMEWKYGTTSSYNNRLTALPTDYYMHIDSSHKEQE